LHIRGKFFDSFAAGVFDNKAGEIIGLKFAILVGA
jgi:hypothetical protein